MLFHTISVAYVMFFLCSLIYSFIYQCVRHEALFLLNQQIKKALRGVRVEVTHRGNMRRKYRISGLTSQATRELT
jgi:hypothetical protein